MYWTFAARYFCLACNVTAKHGETSAWRKRFNEEFTGVMYPFVCLVSYVPPKDKRVPRSKMGPNAIEGVYLGYRIYSGGRVQSDHLVIDLREFDNIDWITGKVPSGNGHRLPHVDRTSEIAVIDKKNWRFPMKEAFDKFNTSMRNDNGT